MKLASVIIRLWDFHEFLAMLSYFPRNRLPHLDLASASPPPVSEVSSARTLTPLMRSRPCLDFDPAAATLAFGAVQPGWLELALRLSFLISR